jgi:aminoglycoside phosphotransferase (APT) family kinase protein
VAHKIETEVATLTYLCNHTRIPVPVIHGHSVGDWQTDYILMGFVEGQILRRLWFDLSPEEQIPYVKQIAAIYAELDRTSFTSIGLLRLDGTIGPLDTLDKSTNADGQLVGVNQLATDPLLVDNADLCPGLYRWAELWSAQAPDSLPYSLFRLECMKMEDMLVKDGRIVAVLDFENFQINVPEFLKLCSPIQFGEV